MARYARGFSLLEVLLASSVLAAGLALALATLHAARVSVERTEAMSAREERIRAVHGVLRRRLNAALAVSFGEDQDGRVLRFVGEPERIAFVAEMPASPGGGGPGLHTLAVHHEPDGRRWLGIRFAHVLAGAIIDATPARAPDILVEDLVAFHVRFRSPDRPGQPGGWSEHWAQVDTLPLQVEINISSAAGAWPSLRVNLPQGGAR